MATLNTTDFSSPSPPSDAAPVTCAGSEPRRFTVSCERELQIVLRDRADELELSREALDELAGFQSGYSSKLLAILPTKGIGPRSMFALAGALGLAVVLVVDERGSARIPARGPPHEWDGEAGPEPLALCRRARDRCRNVAKVRLARRSRILCEADARAATRASVPRRQGALEGVATAKEGSAHRAGITLVGVLKRRDSTRYIWL